MKTKKLRDEKYSISQPIMASLMVLWLESGQEIELENALET